MIDLNKMAAGLASDLLHASDQSNNAQAWGAQALIEDAFRRGLQLGLSVSQRDAFRVIPQPNQGRMDARLWTTKH